MCLHVYTRQRQCINKLWTLHCDKKWAKRSFPLENNLPEEGKFPCGYWNIYPFTHTVFIHSSVREKCSRPWAGTFYRSKKGKLPGVDFSHRYFRKIPAFRISQGHFRKIPAFLREECSRSPPPPRLILEKLTLSNKRLSHFKILALII